MRLGGSVKSCTLRKSNMAPTQPTQTSPAGTGAERLRLLKRCKQGQARPVPRPLCPDAVGWPPRGSPPGSCWGFWTGSAAGMGLWFSSMVPSLFCSVGSWFRAQAGSSGGTSAQRLEVRSHPLVLGVVGGE